MKSFIAISCLFFMSVNGMNEQLRQEMLARLNDIGQKCIAETNASADEFKNLLAHIIPTSHEGQCMIFCIHKALKVQKDDGSLDISGTLETLKKVEAVDADIYNKLMAAAQVCLNKVVIDSDSCVTAANIGTCFVTEGKKVGLSTELFE